MTKRDEIGREVITSMLRILSAAGYEMDEIDQLFRQTLDSAGDEGGAHLPENVEDDDDSDALYEIAESFRTTEISKRLTRLMKRFEAIGNLETDSALDTAGQLVLELLPALKQAQDWHRSYCENNSIPYEFDRETWLKKATDEELDAEDKIFFDSTAEYREDTFLWRISSFLRGAQRFGLAEILKQIKDRVQEVGAFLGAELSDELNNSIDGALLRGDFEQRILALPPGFEAPQNEFLQSGQTNDSHQVRAHSSSWADQLAQRGLIKRYKKGSRWFMQRI